MVWKMYLLLKVAIFGIYVRLLVYILAIHIGDILNIDIHIVIYFKLKVSLITSLHFSLIHYPALPFHSIVLLNVLLHQNNKQNISSSKALFAASRVIYPPKQISQPYPTTLWIKEIDLTLALNVMLQEELSQNAQKKHYGSTSRFRCLCSQM